MEYKREAFELFDAMIDSIKEEAVELLFRVQVVREEKMTSVLKTPAKAEYLHPEAARIGDAAEEGPAPIPAAGNPSLLRPAGKPPASGRQVKTETIRRAQPKVGRNDPCPCGSGKKYKKCHGAND